ncbi:MAG: hypothetical protein IPJ19_15000 [Planctomycetes bacterium]|nr:hypothetical protein [Planctomycetota bacterium]
MKFSIQALAGSRSNAAPRRSPVDTKRLMLAFGVAVLAATSSAQLTERVSVTSTGAQAWGGGEIPTPPANAVSADGRFVAFMSVSPDIVSGDTNNKWDVFVRDRLNRTTERVSVSSSGGQANAHSGIWGLAMSRDARFVVFQTDSTNLVTGGTNGAWHIILRDRLNGTTELVSVDSNGVQGNGG